MFSKEEKALVFLLLMSFSTALLKDTLDGALIPGNISIGGLISMHLPGKDGNCSKVSTVHGMELMEALLFSVDRINANKTLLPNITLGVKAFDTCGSETAALDRAVKEFVLGEAWGSPTGSCTPHERPVVGVIGPTFSYEAVHVAKLLEVFEIPLISYFASSPKLSDKSKYLYFSRTIPSDTFQTKAIVDLLKYFNWTYVSVLYSGESYGLTGFEALKQEAHKNGICFANERKVPMTYDQEVYQTIVGDIMNDQMANVVVLFCQSSVLSPLIQEIQGHGQFGSKTLQFVGTQTLGTAINENFKELQEIAKHVLYMSPPTTSVSGFGEYFLNLSPPRNKRNPWFKDFFQKVMNCSFGENSGKRAANQRICNPNSTLGSANFSTSLRQFKFMSLVFDGVYAFVHALHYFQRDRCANCSNKACVALLNSINGKELLDTIRTLTFNSPSGSIVNFSRTGDVTGAFDIYYLGDASNKSYKNLKIGKWNHRQLSLPPSDWKKHFVPMNSHCAISCGVNQIRRRSRDKPCCQECVSCRPGAFSINETACHSCPKGQTPDGNLLTCIRIKAKYFTLDGDSISRFVVVLPIIVSTLGIIAVFFIAFVFVKFSNTPLVKASGRELSYLLLFGLFLSFLFPFVAISKPSPFKCFCQFILDSLPFTISFVAIAVKNNRTYRIFNLERDVTIKPSFTRPKSQIMLSLGLISFQAFLLLTLMKLERPRPQLIYPTSTEIHLICVPSSAHLFFSHVYNMFLLIACTYYAYKTRHVPRNFNEAKYVTFAMFGSCITALAFIVVFLLTAKVSGTILNLAVSCFRVVFMATLLLLCFFGHKIYIILWKSEQNRTHATLKNRSSSSLAEKDRIDMFKNRCHGEQSNCVGLPNVKKVISLQKYPPLESAGEYLG